jgi:tRNA A37 threonylcarbamoyladenosine biosynthesis protein TsaE
MHIELNFMPHLMLEVSEPLTVPQYWLKSGHTLSPAQSNLISHTDAFKQHAWDVCLLTGDTASGKTHAAVMLGIQLAVENPMSMGLVTAPSQAILTYNVVEKYRQLLPQLGLIAGQDYRLSQKQIRFANGSRIRFMSAASKHIDLIECQWIHADYMHDLSETQFNRLLAQLRQPHCDGHIDQLRFFGTGRPMATGWQTQMFTHGNPYGFRHLTTQTQDNPSLPACVLEWLATRQTCEETPEKSETLRLTLPDTAPLSARLKTSLQGLAHATPKPLTPSQFNHLSPTVPVPKPAR